MWRVETDRSRLLSLFLLIGCVFGATPIQAGDIDADTARQLQSSGRILPLAEVVDKAQALHPGTVLEVELEREDEALIYEIEMLGADGEVMELQFNAATGEMLEMQKDD